MSKPESTAESMGNVIDFDKKSKEFADRKVGFRNKVQLRVIELLHVGKVPFLGDNHSLQHDKQNADALIAWLGDPKDPNDPKNPQKFAAIYKRLTADKQFSYDDGEIDGLAALIVEEWRKS